MGNQYIMVAYNHDSNAMLVEPISSRAVEEMLRAMKGIHEYLKEQGLHPELRVLDNGCPSLVKQFFK